MRRAEFTDVRWTPSRPGRSTIRSPPPWERTERRTAVSYAAPALVAGYDYRRIWLWLCLGWLVSSMDRTITGPVVTWMIQNKVSFMATENPYALGGLVGSIFFTGYMLTQFPGGYAGDRFGHRSGII